MGITASSEINSSSEDNLSEVNLEELFNNCNNVEELIDIYYKHYPIEHYLNYPEFCVNKLMLDKKLLENIPNKDLRTREDIRDWCKNSKITYNEIIYVGW